MPFRGTLQDIRIFVAVYEERSFTGAAKRENTTQPGVSHHIRNLETAFGVKLFVRESVGLSTTPAAQLLYPRYVAILRDVDDTANQLQLHVHGHQGKLDVGVSPALCRYVTTSALQRFEEVHPDVVVRVVETMGYPSLALVKSGQVDFAVSSLADEGGDCGVRTRTLLAAQNCLLSRAQAGDRNGVSRTLPEGPLDLIWPSGAGERRGEIVASLRANGISIRKEMVIDSALTVLHFVANSDWRTVGPCVIIDPIADAARYSIIPLKNPDAKFRISLVESTSRALDPAAQDFLDILVEEIHRADAAWAVRFAEAGLT